MMRGCFSEVGGRRFWRAMLWLLVVTLTSVHSLTTATATATATATVGESSSELDQELSMSGSTVCKTFPGLSKDQMDLCHRFPEVTSAAFQGLQVAVQECQFQFQWHRWNCFSLNTKNRNPHSSVLLQRGYRESAFAYAISSAGVAHSVARACGQGKLMECGCDPAGHRGGRRGFRTGGRRRDGKKQPMEKSNSASRWKWGGCSHNLDYGIEFSKEFLDSREVAGDIQSRINLHNNQAGRLALASNMQVRCKCHGMSGSCELKTCWKASPDFRLVGETLKNRFRSAVLVDQSNLGSGSPLLDAPRRRNKGRRRRPNQQRPRRRTRDRDLARDLVYFQPSPNFCERDASVDFPGTGGRQCNRTSNGVDGCGSLCCGRGYNVIRQRRTDRCHCRFHWCCHVICQNCTVEEWITVCK